ncbi:hypothetical protein L8648_000381 [Campylobacter lari]|nr:hypothetical protein [Campylobacter lari]
MSKNKFWKKSIDYYKDNEKIIISSFEEFKIFLDSFMEYEISFQRSGCQKVVLDGGIDVYDFLNLFFDSEENIFVQKQAIFYFNNGESLYINYLNNNSIKDQQEILYEFFKNLDSLLKEYQRIHFYHFNDKELFFTEKPKIEMKIEYLA